MTLSQFITYLKKQCGGANRTDILELVNIAHNEAMGIDNSFTRVKPDIILATNDEVYEYSGTDISTDNIRRIASVYTKTSVNYYDSFRYETKYSHYDELGDRIYNVPVSTIDSAHPSNSDAAIIFPSSLNPGNTLNVYYVEAYKWPLQLVSESVAVALPMIFWNKVLEPRVMDMLEVREYGNGISHVNRWQQGMKEWISYSNKSLTGDNSQIQYRDV
jgi:hypothetical protein